MRQLSSIVLLAACSAGACSAPEAASPDAGPAVIDAAADAASGVPVAGFGDLAGMCGVLADPELLGATPLLVRGTLDFTRAYVDPDDRPLLTPGGRRLIETPNAGGSSELSEVFAYEQLARCELATLLETETEITYETDGKKTDLLVTIDGHKIGVSVTRAMAFPLGDPYTLEAATTLLFRKLEDVQAASANVSAEDRWEKQILAYVAWDEAAADMVAEAWQAADSALKADTILLVTATGGDDVFIYTNQ